MSINQFSYHGSVSIPLLTNAVLDHQGMPTVQKSWNLQAVLSDSSRTIQWKEQNFPASLKNITIPEFLTSTQWQRSGLSKLTTFVTVTGVQKYGVGLPDGNTTYSLKDDQGIVYSEVLPIYHDPFNDVNWPSVINKNINLQRPSFRMPVQATLSNTMGPNYPNAYNVYYSIVIDVLASASCTGNALDTPFCVDVCTANAEARTKCRNSYLEYCTPPVLAASSNCQSFVETLIQNDGPIPSLDLELQSYCSQKYQGFGDLNNSTSEIDKQLCACHMPAKQYEALETQVFAEFPEISHFYAQKNLCIFPLCVSSPYIAAPIDKGGCKIPQCLNIAEFNNAGKFTGNVTVNQSCQPSSGGGTSNLAILALVLFILILVIAIVIYLAFA